MKIDTATIEGYEGMSVEQKLAALEGFEYEDHSAEVATLKNTVSKANSEAAEWKRKHHSLLSEDEKKATENAEREAKLQSDLDKANRTIAVSGYTAQLMANGYPADLASATAEAMASGDMATVFANQKSFLEGYEKNVKAEMLKHTPKPQVNGSGSDLSVDDLEKQANDAIAAGNAAKASHYIRLLAEKNAAKK